MWRYPKRMSGTCRYLKIIALLLISLLLVHHNSCSKNGGIDILFVTCLIPNHGVRFKNHIRFRSDIRDMSRNERLSNVHLKAKEDEYYDENEKQRGGRITALLERRTKEKMDENQEWFSMGKEVTPQTELVLDEEEEAVFGMSVERVAKPLGLLLFAQFVLFIGVGAVIPTLPLYGKAIGLSSAANGVVISAPAVMLLLLAKPAGNLSDKARKPAMMGGMLLIALSDLGTACASTLFPLILARLGLGAGRCISESGERGMLADLASRAPELRGRALAAQQACTALGIAIGAPLGGYIVELYGPRASFLCVTGAALLSLFLYIFLPETIPPTTTTTTTVKEDTASIRWAELLQDQRWRGLSLCEVGVKVGYAVKLTCIPILATSILPGGAVGAGALLSAAGLTGLVGSPMGGWFTDRIGAKPTSILSGIIAGSALILLPFVIHSNSSSMQQEGFTACVILWSLAVSAQGPALTAIAQQLAPVGQEATAMSLPRASGDAVYLFAPFLLGIIADNPSLPMATECAVAGLSGILGVLALFLLSSEE